MGESAISPLTRWENYYVIVGSSAGALTGLQFVVIALLADTRGAGTMQEVRAFGTPTVVHFCAALLISAIASAPWHDLSSAGIGFAVCGIAGVGYAISVIRHAQRAAYNPDTEDWVWYAVLPLLAYSALLMAAIFLARHFEPSSFVIAASAIVLVFVGIHNSWDSVTYIALKARGRNTQDENRGKT